MSKHPIDELFRKNLGGLEEDYPQHLWQGVADRLGQSKNPRRALWLRWTSLGLFLLFAFAGGAYFITNADVEKNGLSKNESMLTADVSTESTERSQNLPAQDVGEMDRSISDDATSSETALNQTEANQDIEEVSTYSSQSTIPNNKTTYRSIEIDRAQSIGTQSTSTTSRRGNYIRTSDGDLNVTSREKPETKPEDKLIANRQTNEIENSLMVETLRSKMETGRMAFETAFIDSEVGGIKYDLLDKSSKRLMRRHSKKNFGYSKNRMILKWGIAGIYSTDFAVRQMNNRTPEGLALLNYRNENERFVNAFSTGFEVSLRWHQLSFITGLIYSQVNDEYTFIQDNAERIVDGAVVIGRYEQRIINRYASYELPILVQYEMSKGRWVFGAGFGMHIGLHYSTSGQIFDEAALAAVDLESVEGSVYRSSLSAAPVLSMLAGYKLGYKSLLFFRPSVRHYLEPLTKDEYAIDHRQQIMSLSAGIRYTIN